MTREHKHDVEIDGMGTVVVLLAVLWIAATWLDDTERAIHRAAIQKCWDKGGVPVFAWYSTNKLADCKGLK